VKTHALSLPGTKNLHCATAPFPRFSAEAAAGQYVAVFNGGDLTPIKADLLKIEIISLVGRGGGAWSGEKSMMIKGSLVRQGQSVMRFKSLRISRGGTWGPYMGTCAILRRCVKTLSEDVVDWLKNPSDNAKLGDL
jgi:hypothetical protein